MAIISLIKNIFGTRNERVLKDLTKIVAKINALENEYAQLSDAQLANKTSEFRQRLTEGASLDSLLTEAFATVREASKRVLNMRHFDVQLIGGMVLHQGCIAEMRTGEGKTLVATLPAYLNALEGKGVHIITVNDYLAKRDASWMAPVYEFLGMKVGVILSEMPHADKKSAYAADITYGTNNEFGFDYLRDNMAFNFVDKVQRPLNYAIVDEVDSILIDEARTPLIISGPSEESSELYVKINQLIPKLRKRESEEGEGDYYIEEKNKQAYLTEEGHQRVEELMTEVGLLKEGDSLYDASHITLMHHLNAALRAHNLYHKDVDYIVRNGEIIIVDEHTGRTMIGRRWSDGLHQAVEAKEKVRVQNENQTLASITFQNYFRLYNKLAGMTGTADTEAYEFQQIYGLEVVVIPTNKSMQRKDLTDQIYLTGEEKFSAIINDIKACLERQQPVLVGTVSIEASEHLSQLLNREKIKHQVLNAKYHETEAKIIAQAGRPGTVTIATNMAGRGTDIVLGGNLNAEIAELENPSTEQIAKIKEDWQVRHATVINGGGLHIIGSERHESRRIDNQLRGRSGRQGDSGSTRFYLSLQDNLMRIFASDRVAAIMKRLGMKYGEAIEHPWVNKAIENAQRKVESFNFDIRKQLLEYDDVANEQRKVVYQQRDALMSVTDISESIKTIRTEVLNALMDSYVPPDSLEEQWDIAGLQQQLEADFMLKLPLTEMLEKDANLDEKALREFIIEQLTNAYNLKEQQIGSETMRVIEKSMMLQTLDIHWKEHLAAMDHLRQGIHLRGYAQKNPKQEYKREAFNLFSNMLDSIKHKVISQLSMLQMPATNAPTAILPTQFMPATVNYQHAEVSAFAGEEVKPQQDNESIEAVPFKRDMPKVGRNDPCYCGSGKKFKFCHGTLN